MKRLILLTFILSIGLRLYAMIEFTIDNITYKTLNNNELLVSGCTCEHKHDVVQIPPHIEYEGVTYDVTSIGYGAFLNCLHINELVLPATITSINSRAFEGCSTLTTVTLPDNLKEIADHAFYKCSALKSIYIPNSIDSIGNYAFAECNAMTSARLPQKEIAWG